MRAIRKSGMLPAQLLTKRISGLNMFFERSSLTVLFNPTLQITSKSGKIRASCLPIAPLAQLVTSKIQSLGAALRRGGGY